MSDIKNRILAKYKLTNRYSNFGPILNRIQINGFRGINAVEVNFEYPVTAISGLNGSGKSTIGQRDIVKCCVLKKHSSPRC
jgi:predicted ATPase